MSKKNDLWKLYFDNEEEKEIFKAKVLDKSNIIAAYIRIKNENSFNYEINNRLLFELNSYNLKDGIDSEIIQKVNKILEDFFENYNSFEGMLILKIKNIQEKEYRPLCIMRLEDEIAINCFLNIFLNEIKNKIKLGENQFGNVSPLLNYYNIENNQLVENNIEDLYLEKWQKSYKQYNEFIIKQLEKKEINVYITDIKSFFVSINLERFFEFIANFCENINIKIFKKVFILKVRNNDVCENNNINKLGISKINNEYFFTSLPQGCIFSPIIANLYMFDINDLKLKYAMYVDDLHLFSTKENFEKERNILKEYFESKELKINNEKTTELTNEKLISDYHKLIKNYGSNVSILRSYTINKEVDIEEEKYVLNNPNDIRVFLEDKIKENPELDENNIYQKYLKKIKRLKDYREIRYYKYKTENILTFEKIITNLNNILSYLKYNTALKEEYDIEEIFYKMGAYNAQLYDIESYVEQLLEIYNKCDNSYMDNVLFRFLNRNLLSKYEAFQKITEEKNNILFKEEFYNIRNLIYKKNNVTLENGYINIKFINEEINNTVMKKKCVLRLFEEIKNKQVYNIENIFYKMSGNQIEFKFVNIDKEVKTIIDDGKIFPERTIIRYISKLIELLLSNKKKMEYSVWEYRLYIISKSYHKKANEYIDLIITVLNDEIGESYEYVEQDILKIFENSYIPKLWKENYKYVDGLLKLYLIVKKIWEQGSKNLYFYTLHNCEHTKVLLKNFEIFIKGQYWKLGITQLETLYVYVAFILHDIGMLYIENTELLNKDTNKINEKIYDYMNKLDISDYVDYIEYIKQRYNVILKERKLAKYKRRRFIFKQEKSSKKIYDFYEGFIGIYTRELHALFSVILIENDALEIKKIIKEMGLDIKVIYTLILGHADIKNQLKFKAKDVDIKMLIEIIKLIDFSDITANRVNYEFYKMFKNSIPKKSCEEYDKHLSVKGLKIDCSKLDENEIIFLAEKCGKSNISLKHQAKRYSKFMRERDINMTVKYEEI